VKNHTGTSKGRGGQRQRRREEGGGRRQPAAAREEVGVEGENSERRKGFKLGIGKGRGGRERALLEGQAFLLATENHLEIFFLSFPTQQI